MTVITDMIKKHGTWMSSAELQDEVMKSYEVDLRQAFRKIENELNKKKTIQKAEIPNIGVVYGLHQWSKPEAKRDYVRVSEFFLTEFWVSLYKVKDLWTHEKAKAYEELTTLVYMLPEQAKKVLVPKLRPFNEVFGDNMSVDKQERYFLRMVSKIADILHETLVV